MNIPDQATLMLLFFVLLIITGVVLVAGFVLLFIKRWIKGGLTLNSANSPLSLGELSEYFTSVRLDGTSNTLLFTQSGNFARCVVTVIGSANGKKKMKRYALSFSDNEKTCGIQLGALHFDEYAVFVDSVDGKLKKHQSLDLNGLIAIILGVVIAVLFGIAVIIYVLMWSWSLPFRWDGYALFYLQAAYGLFFPAIGIGGYFLIDFLSKKGGR